MIHLFQVNADRVLPRLLDCDVAYSVRREVRMAVLIVGNFVFANYADKINQSNNTRKQKKVKLQL